MTIGAFSRRNQHRAEAPEKLGLQKGLGNARVLFQLTDVVNLAW